MHPILGHSRRLLLYLALWLPVGLLLAWILGRAQADLPPAALLILALPIALCDAFLCLAAWYPCRTTPLDPARLWSVVATHAFAAALSSGLWQVESLAWAMLLEQFPLFEGAGAVHLAQMPLLFAAGVLFYFLAAAGSYLFIALDHSRRAEQIALEARKDREMAEKELELARQLQRRLLPPPYQKGAGFEIVARNLAARFVAGDFYDYFRLPDGRVRIAVADVAGKGMAASLIMATVKAILPLLAAERSVVETLRELNRKLAAELAPREFVALLLATWDPAGGRLEIANAGLPDPYHLAGGVATALSVAQPRLPLGLRADVEYGSLTVDLAPGERVLFLTDGLPEAPIARGEPLGYEALEKLLTEDAGQDKSAEAWLDRLLERMREVSIEQGDDWTAVVLEAG